MKWKTLHETYNQKNSKVVSFEFKHGTPIDIYMRTRPTK